MRELATLDKVRRILTAAGMENYGDGYVVMDVTTGYAEPGYGSDDDVIVFGNWNPKRFPRGDDAPLTKDENLGPRLARILEAAGAEIQWYDEWARCGDCYRAFRTSGDSYQWTMYGDFSEDACDYICADCLVKDPETLIEEYVNNSSKALTFLSGPDLVALGFEQHNGTFENGWHEGQDDDPSEILERILKFAPDGTEVVFTIPEVSQFYVRFNAYVRTPENDDDVDV